MKRITRLLAVAGGAALVCSVVFAAPASAVTVPVEASGSFETETPATPPASLTVSAGGQEKTVSVPGSQGGTLALNFVANQVNTVDLTTSDCPSGQIGRVITVAGFSQGTLVSASFTSPQTGTIVTPPTTVDRGGGATASLCGFVV